MHAHNDLLDFGESQDPEYDAWEPPKVLVKGLFVQTDLMKYLIFGSSNTP